MVSSQLIVDPATVSCTLVSRLEWMYVAQTTVFQFFNYLISLILLSVLYFLQTSTITLDSRSSSGITFNTSLLPKLSEVSENSKDNSEVYRLCLCGRNGRLFGARVVADTLHPCQELEESFSLCNWDRVISLEGIVKGHICFDIKKRKFDLAANEVWVLFLFCVHNHLFSCHTKNKLCARYGLYLVFLLNMKALININK